MALQEIRVGSIGRDVKGRGVFSEAQRTIGIPALQDVKTARVYRLEGITEEEAQRLARALFVEPIDQTVAVNKPLVIDTQKVVEVAYKPGVMNPESASILKAARDLGIGLVAADSSTEYAFYGSVSAAEVDQIVQRLLMNKTVEHVVVKPPRTLLITGEAGLVATVPIREAIDQQLLELSKDKLFLNLEEMQVIQRYFNKLGRNPTDCELEIIAARWSEHCGHKTFKAKVVVDGMEKLPLFTRITETARQYFGDLVISAFEDNSGVMRFYDGQAICGKVETHNSPSAIEPYGGAMTGSGGVFRDILGTGQGAKVVISTDVFCFAPLALDPATLPEGCLHPDYLQRRVVAGVRDYGNRMGIPTNNGSVHYHPDFRAKPSVIVGAYGILPEKSAQKGQPRVGDFVVVIGGKTGRDGIHGATFSSGEMTERTAHVNASAVQIGNAIEEKRMADAIIEARDCGYIRAITDCGAAGFSSAIGEMGENVGVTVDISRASLKYPGLSPWEIWLSESQERMVVAVDPNNKTDFLAICRKYNVEATVLGCFDGSHRLQVMFGEHVIADLDYDFLKHGLPQRTMKARWEKPVAAPETPEFRNEWIGWIDALKKVLAHGNVCSKESIVRQYDHGVQGTNALSPFGGIYHDGPNDAVVITPILGKPYGLIVSHGLNPVLNRKDPYWGSVWAVAEAMANYVAVGGNPDEACLINNYIFPVPDEMYMGALDESVDAVVDCMHALERPVISGKDSLSSTYRGNGQVIQIPPVLCISVFGRIPDVEKTVTSDFKKPGSTLLLVGHLDPSMGGSVYEDIFGPVRNVHGEVNNKVPRVHLGVLPDVLRVVHHAIQTGKVLSCHDVSEGGVLSAVCEMSFGGDIGAIVTLPRYVVDPDVFLFNETAGCFVIEVENEAVADDLFSELPYPYIVLGKTTREKELRLTSNDAGPLTVSIDELKQAWKSPLQKVFQ
ncbi:MAG: phosphoribosylformylglycinamidine synthase subunit PurL [bacterium]|nr:phosphoribosylformylglycinamidine synthase subunit PurL [bacterium]